jgi:VanZ family protein
VLGHPGPRSEGTTCNQPMFTPTLYNEAMASSKISRLRIVLDWVPAALSVLLIFLESTATMSSENTSHWLYPLWVWLFGRINPAHWAEVHHLIRKTGHFVGYGLVSLAFFYSWRQTLRRMAVQHWTLWRRASVLAVVCTLLIAISDEYHQSFLPTRTSSPLDVCIDLSGAIAAQLLLLLVIQFVYRRPALSA